MIRGPIDGLVLDITPLTGKDFGCSGGRAGETIDMSNVAGTRVTVFLTLVTAYGATAKMTV